MDFTHPQIGWNPKADSVAAILEALKLTPKSLVFVDDNPVERESVRTALPGTRVIGSDPFLTRRILLWSAETQVATLSLESSRRETMIRGQIERDQHRAAMGREAFLDSLQCAVVLTEVTGVDHPSFSRLLELVNKTNQFNTTGERWSAAWIQSYVDNGGRLFTFTVQDKFVMYGLVGVVFVVNCAILQFVMSCRVIGMEVEGSVVAALVAKLRRIHGDCDILGRLLPPASNGPCRDVFLQSGFCLPPGEQTVFTLPQGAEVKKTRVMATWSGYNEIQ